MTAPSTAAAKGRKTHVLTRSPEQEFFAREGDTIMLPAAVEAAWLDQSHFVQIRGKVVTITHQKKDYRFTHPDSPTIQAHNATGSEFIARFNPLTAEADPDALVCHLYTLKGEYIETLPRDISAARFDYDAANDAANTKEAISALARHNNATLKRLDSLHQKEAQERLKQEQHNARELGRVSGEPLPPQIEKLTLCESTAPPVKPESEAPAEAHTDSRIPDAIAASFEAGMQAENISMDTASRGTEPDRVLRVSRSGSTPSNPDPAAAATNRIAALRKANKRAEQLAVQALDFHIEDVPLSDDPF